MLLNEDPQKVDQAADGPSQKDISDRERHQEMSRLLTGGAANGGTAVNDGTFGRRRVGPTPERNLIAAQTEALRKSPADGESPDDELLDGVVRNSNCSSSRPPRSIIDVGQGFLIENLYGERAQFAKINCLI